MFKVVVPKKRRGLTPVLSRPLRLVMLAAGVAGWCLFGIRAVQAIATFAVRHDPSSIYLLDWRVYYSGARDLLERDLYLDSGISVGNLPMPVDVFNYPPMSALLGVPLTPFGFELGGLVWIFVGALALGAAAYVTAEIIDRPDAIAIVGVPLLIYALHWNFPGNVVVGNVNSLVLLIIAGFALAHERGRHFAAGALLGLAIAIKAWPVPLAILLIRERRWREFAIAVAVVVGQGLVFLIWLGADAVSGLLSALRTSVTIPDGSVLLWTSWARTTLDWWPAWGSIGIAALLLLIPAVGRLGLGVAMLAGLTLIPNLWDHYLPTFVFAFVLIASSREVRRLFAKIPLPPERARSQPVLPAN